MICSSKEWDSCREEKMGCDGCHFEPLNREELKRRLREGKVEKETIIEVLECIERLERKIKQYNLEVIPCFEGEIRAYRQRIKELEEIETEHRKINGELRKKEQKTTEALELINSYILEILNKQKK